MDLDFSILSDDQLVELIRAACQEAITRGEAVAFAARSAMLSEAEKAKIAQSVRDAEAQRAKEREVRFFAEKEAVKVRFELEEQKRKEQAGKTQQLWEKKDAIVNRAKDLLAEVIDTAPSLQVWNKSDKRIYVNKLNGRLGANHVVYYHDGNGRTRPGTLVLSEPLAPKREEILQFCQDLCSKWNTLRVDL